MRTYIYIYARAYKHIHVCIYIHKYHFQRRNVRALGVSIEDHHHKANVGDELNSRIYHENRDGAHQEEHEPKLPPKMS